MRDTIDMAREAGMDVDGNTSSWGEIITAEPAELKVFEALVRADEREACAKLIESTDLGGLSGDRKLQNFIAELLFQYAAAIRARETHEKSLPPQGI